MSLSVRRLSAWGMRSQHGSVGLAGQAWGRCLEVSPPCSGWAPSLDSDYQAFYLNAPGGVGQSSQSDATLFKHPTEVVPPCGGGGESKPATAVKALQKVQLGLWSTPLLCVVPRCGGCFWARGNWFTVSNQELSLHMYRLFSDPVNR